MFPVDPPQDTARHTASIKNGRLFSELCCWRNRFYELLCCTLKSKRWVFSTRSDLRSQRAKQFAMLLCYSARVSAGRLRLLTKSYTNASASLLFLYFVLVRTRIPTALLCVLYLAGNTGTLAPEYGRISRSPRAAHTYVDLARKTTMLCYKLPTCYAITLRETCFAGDPRRSPSPPYLTSDNLNNTNLLVETRVRQWRGFSCRTFISAALHPWLKAKFTTR